jgi:hypothetical protein
MQSLMGQTPTLDSSFNGDKGLARMYLRNGLSRKTALHRFLTEAPWSSDMINERL